ncbi:MAG TPA: hypothetical protein VGB66_08655 [Longimicrobium sp.]|jgi:hypothetical protein
MMPSESNVEQRREAQRAAARRRQANFRARERARGLEMVTLKVPASMRDALARLAACIRAEEPSEEALEESFAELRAEVATRRAGSAPPAPAPEIEAPALPEEPAPQPWVDLAGLWKSSASVASLTDFSVMLADLDGTLYARWTARLQRADGTASVDAYVRGTRSGPQDTRVSVDRMRLGGRTLQFQGVIAGPERMEGTLTLFTADDEGTPYPAVFTRAG